MAPTEGRSKVAILTFYGLSFMCSYMNQAALKVVVNMSSSYRSSGCTGARVSLVDQQSAIFRRCSCRD